MQRLCDDVTLGAPPAGRSSAGTHENDSEHPSKCTKTASLEVKSSIGRPGRWSYGSLSRIRCRPRPVLRCDHGDDRPHSRMCRRGSHWGLSDRGEQALHPIKSRLTGVFDQRPTGLVSIPEIRPSRHNRKRVRTSLWPNACPLRERFIQARLATRSHSDHRGHRMIFIPIAPEASKRVGVSHTGRGWTGRIDSTNIHPCPRSRSAVGIPDG
jgi:hypothetical protein